MKQSTSPTATIQHTFVIDGSSAPGRAGGGWAVVQLQQGVLHHCDSGSIPGCWDPHEAEVVALIEALKLLPEHGEVLIICDSRTVVEAAAGRSDGSRIPRRKDLANALRSAHDRIILQWRPSKTMDAQRLAHHLANVARLRTLIEDQPAGMGRGRRQKKTGARMRAVQAAWMVESA